MRRAIHIQQVEKTRHTSSVLPENLTGGTVQLAMRDAVDSAARFRGAALRLAAGLA